MSRNSFSVFLVLALTLIFSTITASAQQPRALPSNDNLITPTVLQIGKSQLVPDIGAATNEATEPVSTCKSGSVIPHSVWFVITLPTSSSISLSTFGSQLLTPQVFTMDTMLAVYELTGPGTFAERACSDDTNGIMAAQLVFAATAGKTYYIAAGTFSSGPFLPESTLKLTSRMLATTIVPLNYDFEAPITDPGWKLKNADNDQIVCSNPTYFAVNGACVFRFSGAPGITTKLVQTLPFPATFTPRKNAFLSGIFYFRVMDTAALANTKVKFIVNYSDGTPPSTLTLNLAGAALPTYDIRLFALPLKSGKVASVKLLFKFGESAGTLLVDYIWYYYDADPGTRASGLLPLPVPPSAQ